MVEPQHIDGEGEGFVLLHFLDLGSHGVDDYLVDRRVLMLDMAQEEVEIGGAVGLKDVGGGQARKMQLVDRQYVLIQIKTSDVGLDGIDVTQDTSQRVAQREVVDSDVALHVEVEDVFGAAFGSEVQRQAALQRVDGQGLLQVRLDDVNT